MSRGRKSSGQADRKAIGQHKREGSNTSTAASADLSEGVPAHKETEGDMDNRASSEKRPPRQAIREAKNRPEGRTLRKSALLRESVKGTRRRGTAEVAETLSRNAPRKLPTLFPLNFKNTSKLAKALAVGSVPDSPKKRQGAGKSKGKSKRDIAAPGIPLKQLKLPVSYTSDGSRLASLREYLDDNTPTLSTSQLTYDQRAAIVMERIASTPAYKVNVLTAGEVNMQRALAEIKSSTQVGKALVALESYAIEHFVELAKEGK